MKTSFEAVTTSFTVDDVSDDALALLYGDEPPLRRVEATYLSEPAYVQPPTKRPWLTGKRYRAARRAWRRRRRAWTRAGSPMDLRRIIIPAAVVTEVPGAPGTYSIEPRSTPSHWWAPAEDPDARPARLGPAWIDVGYTTEDDMERHPRDCPECQAHKHPSCTGTALDPDTDEFVECECAQGGHA